MSPDLPLAPRQQTMPTVRTTPTTQTHDGSDRVALRDALIRRFAPPSLITDDRDEVIEVIGDVSLGVGSPTGATAATSSPSCAASSSLSCAACSSSSVRPTSRAPDRDVPTADGVVRVLVRRLSPGAASPAIISFVTSPADGSSGDSTQKSQGPQLRSSTTPNGFARNSTSHVRRCNRRSRSCAPPTKSSRF